MGGRSFRYICDLRLRVKGNSRPAHWRVNSHKVCHPRGRSLEGEEGVAVLWVSRGKRRGNTKPHGCVASAFYLRPSSRSINSLGQLILACTLAGDSDARRRRRVAARIPRTVCPRPAHKSHRLSRLGSRESGWFAITVLLGDTLVRRRGQQSPACKWSFVARTEPGKR